MAKNRKYAESHDLLVLPVVIVLSEINKKERILISLSIFSDRINSTQGYSV